jgi:transposase InsO family protein
MQTVLNPFSFLVTCIAGWMNQHQHDFKGKRYLIHDRDPLYTHQFLNMLTDVGIESIKLPPRSPNLNAYAERFVKTIKEGCLERMILFVRIHCGMQCGNS